MPARTWRLLATVMAFMAVAVAAAPSAEAHAALLRTSPANNASLAQAPDEVVLTFNEPLIGLGSTVQVSGSDGVVSQGPVRVIDDTVHQTLKAGPGGGRYRVTWRVTSPDGHPVSGTFAFTVKGASASAATTPHEASTRAPLNTSAPRPATAEKPASSSPLPRIGITAATVALAALAASQAVRRRHTVGKP